MTPRARDPLTRAWLALMALSAASAFVATGVSHGLFRTAAGALILLLAFLKARIILSRYLGLWQAPAWRAGFNLAIGLYCLALLSLYLIPDFFG